MNTYRTIRHDNLHWDLEKFIESEHYTGWAVIMCNCHLMKEATDGQEIKSLRLSDMSVAPAAEKLSIARMV